MQEMIITPKSSKMKLVIPDGYERLKGKSPVKKDAFGFNNKLGYQKATAGSNCVFIIWKAAANNAMNFDDLPGLIDGIHKTLSDNQGLIQADAGTTRRAYRFIYSIVKNSAHDDILETSYILRMNLASKAEIIEINGAFRESGTTGIRDAIGYELAKRAKLVGTSDEQDPMAGWREDPYDPSYVKGNLMNLSEREGLDEMFPNHPLSQAREFVHALIYDELMLPSTEHGSASDKAEKKALSWEEITLLFAKDAKREFAPVKIEVDGGADNAKSKHRIGKADNHGLTAEADHTSEKKDKGAATKQPVPPKKKLSSDGQITQAISAYNGAYTILNDRGTSLYYERVRSLDIMDLVEGLINSIANQPKSFEVDFGEIHICRKHFTDAREIAEQELKAARETAAGAGAGVAAGAAIAAMAPTAAIWIATTFGTASTGVAISTLSGAAAQSAALAWLGGGALAAGGGGMAAGNALLALAGPIGWGIAGASILASVILFSSSKIKSSKEKLNELSSIKCNTEQLKETSAAVGQLFDKTEALRTNLVQQYMLALPLFGADYLRLSADQKLQLGTLINNTKSLAALLEATITQEGGKG